MCIFISCNFYLLFYKLKLNNSDFDAYYTQRRHSLAVQELVTFQHNRIQCNILQGKDNALFIQNIINEKQ